MLCRRGCCVSWRVLDGSCAMIWIQSVCTGHDSENGCNGEERSNKAMEVEHGGIARNGVVPLWIEVCLPGDGRWLCSKYCAQRTKKKKKKKKNMSIFDGSSIRQFPNCTSIFLYSVQRSRRDSARDWCDGADSGITCLRTAWNF